MHILGMMRQTLAIARAELSAYAPRMITIKIKPEKIRDVIGKGGAVIRAITEETGTHDRHQGRRYGDHRLRFFGGWRGGQTPHR